MQKCKFCGSEEFFVKEIISGHWEFQFRFDGGEADNSAIYDHLKHKRHKKAYCTQCGNCLGNAEELIEVTNNLLL